MKRFKLSLISALLIFTLPLTTLTPATKDSDVKKLQKEVKVLRLKNQKKKLQIDLERKKIDLAGRKIDLARKKRNEQISLINFKENLRSLRERIASRAPKSPYTYRPFKQGTLSISDRKIHMPKVVNSRSAAFVVKRINYYNAQSAQKYPIFLVMDVCYGGEVWAGERIVQTIKTSKSPVYVVVKTFAASMCAIIASASDNSYASPNATILHHQITGGMLGNIIQITNQLEYMQQLSYRTLNPVAKKMGVGYRAFIKGMYKHNINGDWEEFSKEAVKLKWITGVAARIIDGSVRRKPSLGSSFSFFGKADDSYVKMNGSYRYALPPLHPRNTYHLYNPGGFFVISNQL